MRTLFNNDGLIKGRFSNEGGVLSQLTNKTGANSVKGTVISASTTTEKAFGIAPADDEQPIGAVYEDGIADGSECWYCRNGPTYVLLEDGTSATKGYWVKVSDTQAGRADATNAAPPGGTITALEDHFSELGHCLEDKSGGGSITSITRVDSTATVTTSVDHTLETGQEITVSGADQPEYNGTFTITVTGTDEFTYEVSGAPATPATGTITYITINVLCFIDMHLN